MRKVSRVESSDRTRFPAFSPNEKINKEKLSVSGIGGKGEMEAIWQEANFNPIRSEETATIIEGAQSTGAVRSPPVISALTYFPAYQPDFQVWNSIKPAPATFRLRTLCPLEPALPV